MAFCCRFGHLQSRRQICVCLWDVWILRTSRVGIDWIPCIGVTKFDSSTHFGRRSLLLYNMVLPNSSMHVATLFLWSMKSLWAYIEGMVDLSLPFTATNSSDLAAGSDLVINVGFKRFPVRQYGRHKVNFFGKFGIKYKEYIESLGCEDW